MIHNETLSWDELFILQACLIAQKSKDPSTKVGCVIVGNDNAVLSMGFNSFAHGVDESIKERWKSPEKYHWIEHAERNAIFNAVRNGININGARAYLNYEPKPCAECARALIQVGITEIVGPNRPFSGKGAGKHYSIEHSEIMLREAGVIITYISVDIPLEP